MIPKAREVRLKPKIRKVLEACCRAPTTAQRDVKRARIVLLAVEGRSTRSIAPEGGRSAAHCQPLAAALCRARPWWAQGPSAATAAAKAREGSRAPRSGPESAPATTDPHGLIRAGVCTNPEVLELIDATTATSTRRAYQSDLDQFLAWGSVSV
jgi:hypothetical protein